MLLWLLLTACDDDPCPYGSMLATDGGLLVTEAEHPTGWGSSDCTSCHALTEIHRQACTPGIDMTQVRDDVDEQGLASCMGCHGENGTGEDTEDTEEVTE